MNPERPSGSSGVSQPRPSGLFAFVRKYAFSTDHRVIGVQYFLLGFVAALIAVVLSLVMRVHLAWPAVRLPLIDRLSPLGAPGGLLTPEYYLSLLTLHGTLMVFFVLTTVPQSAFGNYFLPLQLGASEMPYPRLNMLSLWLTLASLVVLLSTLFIANGPPISGWTAYAPLSAAGAIAGPGEGMGQTLWTFSIAGLCCASMMTAVNFIFVTLRGRAQGMTWMRMPLTAWAWFVGAAMILLSFPALVVDCVLLLLDHLAGASFFLPAGLVMSGQVLGLHGGSPLLWQHLFWFFGHPEVYITILPAMGLTSHLVSIFSRKPVYGYRAIVYSTVAIGVLGFLVWGHHMFMTGMNPFAAFSFAALTMAISVPSAAEVFSWLGTLYGGSIRFATPMLFTIGFVSVFVTGGLTGIFLAQPSVDMYLHGTYFVVAHLHLVMGVAVGFGIFAATYFWFPKVTGRMMSERLGQAHFWLTFVGAYLTFMPMHFLGLKGNPRRYSSLSAVPFVASLRPVHIFITIAALATAAGQLLFVVNLVWSLLSGARAPDNPWKATSLEWILPSPAPFQAFATDRPVVQTNPYELGVGGNPEVYVTQGSAPPATG